RHVNAEAAMLAQVQEALDLGVEVELVLYAVADEHLQLAVAQVRAVDQLDRVVLADPDRRLVARAEHRADQLPEPDPNQTGLADDFLGLIEVSAVGPEVRVEIPLWAIMGVFPAQVQRRQDADDHAEAIAVADAEVERAEAAHRYAREDVG